MMIINKIIHLLPVAMMRMSALERTTIKALILKVEIVQEMGQIFHRLL